jgi:hypothetical protein
MRREILSRGCWEQKNNIPIKIQNVPSVSLKPKIQAFFPVTFCQIINDGLFVSSFEGCAHNIDNLADRFFSVDSPIQNSNQRESSYHCFPHTVLLHTASYLFTEHDGVCNSVTFVLNAAVLFKPSVGAYKPRTDPGSQFTAV